MKKNLLHLVSVIENGVAGPGTGAIDLIYSSLLQKYGLDYYNHIHINQIGNELNEFLMKEGKKIHINIRYPVYKDFELKNPLEKNIIRLEIIHEALLRLAEKDKRFDSIILDSIKKEILENEFSFDIVYKAHINNKNENIVAKVIVHPEEDRFNFYVLIEDSGKEICKPLIYSGKTTDFYFDDLFFYGQWKGERKLVIKGKQSEIEFHISTSECKVDLINTSINKDKAHVFELMKADADRQTALKDYIHSLDPAIAAIITHNPN